MGVKVLCGIALLQIELGVGVRMWHSITLHGARHSTGVCITVMLEPVKLSCAYSCATHPPYAPVAAAPTGAQ